MTMSLRAGVSRMGPELFHPLTRACSFFSLNTSMLEAMVFHRNSFWRTCRSGAVKSVSASYVFPSLVVMITVKKQQRIKCDNELVRYLKGQMLQNSRKKAYSEGWRLSGQPEAQGSEGQSKGVQRSPLNGRSLNLRIKPWAWEGHRLSPRSPGPCVPIQWP